MDPATAIKQCKSTHAHCKKNDSACDFFKLVDFREKVTLKEQ